MDCAKGFKQSKAQLEVTHKETDYCIPDCSHSNSSCTSILSQDSAVSSIFQSDPPAVQPKPDSVEPLKCLSRIQSSSRGGSGVLGNHDPNRIPVSIFSSRPSNPMEWSTASNESLFSIHVGNINFSRENFNFFTKSGELMMNLNSSQNLPSLPPFVEPPRVENKTEAQSGVDHGKEVRSTAMDEFRGRQSLSNDSMNSSRSFQFPLLRGEGGIPKTTNSVPTNSGTTQQHAVMKLHSTRYQSPSHETTSTSPTAKSSSGWFSCLSWWRCRGRHPK